MSEGKLKANWNFVTRILQSFPRRCNFFRIIFFALYTVGRVTGDEGKMKANWSFLNLSSVKMVEKKIQWCSLYDPPPPVPLHISSVVISR